MRDAFSDVIRELLPFPSVSEATKRKVRALLDEHGRNPGFYFQNPKDKDLLQGDIISNTKIAYIDSSGEPVTLEGSSAMILSNACDIEQGKMVLVCPVFDLDILKDELPSEQVEDTRKNHIYDRFWLPGIPTIGEVLVDFGRTCAVSGKHLAESYREERCKRLSSFSQDGFYFFLTKLTLFLMRPEASDVLR